MSRQLQTVRQQHQHHLVIHLNNLKVQAKQPYAETLFWFIMYHLKWVHLDDDSDWLWILKIARCRVGREMDKEMRRGPVSSGGGDKSDNIAIVFIALRELHSYTL